MPKKIQRTKKRRVANNHERLYLKKKIGSFPYALAPITNIFSSFSDLKVHGSCQLHHFTVAAPPICLRSGHAYAVSHETEGILFLKPCFEFSCLHGFNLDPLML